MPGDRARSTTIPWDVCGGMLEVQAADWYKVNAQGRRQADKRRDRGLVMVKKAVGVCMVPPPAK